MKVNYRVYGLSLTKVAEHMFLATLVCLYSLISFLANRPYMDISNYFVALFQI